MIVILYVLSLVFLCVSTDVNTSETARFEKGQTHSNQGNGLRDVTTRHGVTRSAVPTCETHYALDLALVLDSSYTITAAGWVRLKEAAKDLIGGLDISRRGTQVTVFKYSTDVETPNVSAAYTHTDKLNSDIDELTYDGEWSRLDLALRAVDHHVFAPGGWARVGEVPKAVVVFSDGKTDGPSPPDEEIEWRERVRVPLTSLRVKHVNVFSVGAGVQDQEELEFIAGDPARVFDMGNMDELIVALQNISNAIIPEDCKTLTPSITTITVTMVAPSSHVIPPTSLTASPTRSSLTYSTLTVTKTVTSGSIIQPTPSSTDRVPTTSPVTMETKTTSLATMETKTSLVTMETNTLNSPVTMATTHATESLMTTYETSTVAMTTTSAIEAVTLTTTLRITATTPVEEKKTPVPTLPPKQVKCEVPFHKIGCFKDDQKEPRPLPELLFTDRDPTSPVSTGRDTADWADWSAYLNDLVCRCSTAAKAKGFTFFAIQYYGECWSGPKAGETYKRNGPSDECVSTDFQPCVLDSSYVCSGKADTNYVYGLDITIPPKCDIQYVKVGCYHDNHQVPRPLNDLILTDRDPTDSAYSGLKIDWGDWDNYLTDLVCRCAKVASAKSYNYFGIQYYGECWSGSEAVNTYYRDGQTDSCVSLGLRACPADPKETESPCAGKDMVNYVYNIKAMVPTCPVEYERVGCYGDAQSSPRPLPQLIFTERDPSSDVYSKTIDWGNWDDHMKDSVCRCAGSAKAKEFSYFGVQNYGECWSGPQGAETYSRDGESANCITVGYAQCESHSKECVGKDNANFVYRLHYTTANR